MDDSEFYADIWPKLKETFKLIVQASKSKGQERGQAWEKARDANGEIDEELFNQFWEVRHLKKYATYLIADGEEKYDKNKERHRNCRKKLNRALKQTGCDRGVDDILGAPGQKTIGENKLQTYFAGFAIYHGFDDLAIPRAIVDFLNFCLEHNGGVLSSYFQKPDFEKIAGAAKTDVENHGAIKAAIEKTKDAARARLKKVVLDLRSYLGSPVSDEDWLSASNETAIPFVGRKEELKELDVFAKGHPHKGEFQVWAMVGPSGAGKTRLLNHWVRQIKQDGWEHIKINPDYKKSWDGWVPKEQTLITIDYIYGYDKEIADIIANAKNTVFEHPVRLLLLDHATPNSMEDLLRNPRWGFDGRGPDDFVAKEKSFFFKDAPLKLVAPDKDDEEHPKKYDAFLSEIICAVAYKGKDNPSEFIDEPEIQRGLTYLKKTTGARQPLFAALVGNAIRQGKDSGENAEDHLQFNRRDLIKQYFRGGDRLTWLKEDKKGGAWAACFIAASTARRGVEFKTLIKATSEKDKSAIGDYKEFKHLCNSVVSGNDTKKLKAFEPDILGETHFLLLLNEIDNHLFDFEDKLPALIAAKSQNSEDRSASEFIAFITRLVRNLSNDDQENEGTKRFWELIEQLLRPKNFQKSSNLKWAASIACLESYLILKGKEQIHLAEKFLSHVDEKSLYAPPKEQITSRHIGLTILVSGLKGKDGGIIPPSLLALLAWWDDKKERDYTALMLSLLAGNSTIANYLVGQGTDLGFVCENGWTALMIACLFGQEAVALELAKKKANLWAKNDHRWTALMFACRYDQEAVALELMEKNANLGAKNNQGWTALMLACEFDQEAVALELVKTKANLGAKSDEGWTALMLACEFGREAVALELVKVNANLEEQHMHGATALMFAVSANLNRVVGSLLDKEVSADDIWEYGEKRCTALGLARDIGNQEIITMLERVDALEIPPHDPVQDKSGG